MSRGEAYIHDERREYLAHVLSRTKRKDYENYVVNAVWQRLADPCLQPETQRYVRRDNGYALIDLYFPAVNVGVECDEAYHLGDWQRKSDKAREEEISARLNSVDGAGDYLACHVRAFGTFEQMEHDIDQAVKAINRRKREVRPKPWMPGVPPWETAIEQGCIRVGDGLAFHSIADVCRCFGRNPKRMQRCYFSLQHERYYLWCPKLGIEMPDGTVASAAFGITNTMSYDGKTLYQTTDKYKAGPADDILRVTFARGKDELGRTAYRFIGVFRHDGPKEDDPWTGVDVKVADEIDLSPWN